jgi:hypothetical protein
VSGDAASNQQLGNRWFVESSVGIIWSKTHVDSLNVPGMGVLGTRWSRELRPERLVDCQGRQNRGSIRQPATGYKAAKSSNREPFTAFAEQKPRRRRSQPQHRLEVKMA